jgi:Xaa-Pro aminopeptidase
MIRQHISHTSTSLFDHDRLMELMDRANLDGLVAHSWPNYYYLTGLWTLEYAIDSRVRHFVVIPRYPVQSAIATFPSWEAMTLQSYNASTWIPKKILSGRFYVSGVPSLNGTQVATAWQAMVFAIQLRGLARSRVGFELGQLPVSLFRKLTSQFPYMEIVDVSDLLSSLRMIKTPEEIRRIQIASEIAETASDEIIPQALPGTSERELAQAITQGIVARRADVLYVVTATGASAGLGLPTHRLVQDGDVIRTQVAVSYRGYCASVGRTYVVGPPTEEQASLYRVAYGALQAGLAAIEPGRKAQQVFQAVMRVWVQAGYDRLRREHFGHGVGLELSEPPIFNFRDETLIRPGMVLTVKSPYFVHGLGGFAPEDTVLVGESENTLLTHASPELGGESINWLC